MKTEYEATFLDIDKDDFRKRLATLGAVCLRPEFLQKRVVLNVPQEKSAQHVWLRIRDEGDTVTMTWKSVRGDVIDGQKEILLHVDSFDSAVELAEKIGCVRRSYQESLRELWRLSETEVTIDTWPYLNPLVEVEGESEDVVKNVSEKLGFNWKNAFFASVGKFYRMKYGEQADPSSTPRLTFDLPNPFT